MSLLVVGWLAIGFVWACLAVIMISMQATLTLSNSPSKSVLIAWFIFLLMGPLGILLTLSMALLLRFVEIKIYWRR